MAVLDAPEYHAARTSGSSWTGRTRNATSAACGASPSAPVAYQTPRACLSKGSSAETTPPGARSTPTAVLVNGERALTTIMRPGWPDGRAIALVGMRGHSLATSVPIETEQCESGPTAIRP